MFFRQYSKNLEYRRWKPWIFSMTAACSILTVEPLRSKMFSLQDPVALETSYDVGDRGWSSFKAVVVRSDQVQAGVLAPGHRDADVSGVGGRPHARHPAVGPALRHVSPEESGGSPAVGLSSPCYAGVLSMLRRCALHVTAVCSPSYSGVLSTLQQCALHVTAMCSPCYAGVLSMLQRCALRVTAVCSPCYSGVLSTLRRCALHVTAVCSPCYSGVLSMLQRCALHVTAVCSPSYSGVLSMLCRCALHVTAVCCPRYACVLSMLQRCALHVTAVCSPCYSGVLSILQRCALHVTAVCSPCYSGVLSMLQRCPLHVTAVCSPCYSGVLSMAWCPQDADLLLSCGKDNRILCWNPNSQAQNGEVCPALLPLHLVPPLSLVFPLALVICHSSRHLPPVPGLGQDWGIFQFTSYYGLLYCNEIKCCSKGAESSSNIFLKVL